MRTARTDASRLCLAVVLGSLSTFGSMAQAQTASAAAVVTEPQGTAGQVRTVSVLRAILRDEAASPTDVSGAITELDLLSSKSGPAAYALGEYYRRSNETAQAISYYQRAADAGYVPGLVRLGDLYRTGGDAGLDPSLALAFYEKASAAGDGAAAYRVGEHYRQSGAFDQALKSYELGAGAGDVKSMVRLGDLYRTGAGRGLDPAAAAGWYEKAAAGGNEVAEYELGEMYRSGAGVPVQRDLAESHYRKAIELGSGPALIRLAREYLSGAFGDLRIPEGIALLQRGVTAGVPLARVTLARAYIQGRGVPVDVQKGLSLLNDGYAAKDVDATRQLIQLNVSGRTPGVGRNLALAAKMLEAIGTAMPPDAMAFERLLLRAAAGGDVATLAPDLRALGPPAKRQALTRIYGLNPNAYVYIVQSSLQDRGLYDGTLSGLLTNQTIKAIAGFCATAGISADCSRGPLSSVARLALAPALFPDAAS